MWGEWLAGLGFSLIALALWGGFLASFAMVLTSTRRAYQFGLGAAVVAFLGQAATEGALLALAPTTPIWIRVVVFPPVIEESIRLTAAREVGHAPNGKSWIAFGAGYGLLEAGLKFGDTLSLSIMARNADFLFVKLAVPIVPLLLHVFLSVVVFAMLHARASALKVWVAATALHALHNWSAIAWTPNDYTGVIVSILIRSSAFIALIAGVVWLGVRAAKGPAAAG